MPRSRISDLSAVSIRQRRLMVSCWPVRASSSPARMRLELSLTSMRHLRPGRRCGGRDRPAAARRRRGRPRRPPAACPRPPRSRRSWTSIAPPRSTRSGAADEAVAAHAAEHDADAALGRRSRRPTTASDRPTAGSRSWPASRLSLTLTLLPTPLERRDGRRPARPRSRRPAARRPSSATTRVAARGGCELAGEKGHEDGGKMLGDEDRRADLRRQRLQELGRARGGRRSRRRARGSRAVPSGMSRRRSRLRLGRGGRQRRLARARRGRSGAAARRGRRRSGRRNCRCRAWAACRPRRARAP